MQIYELNCVKEPKNWQKIYELADVENFRENSDKRRHIEHHILIIIIR